MIRGEKIEHLVTTYMMDGKGRGGRTREKMTQETAHQLSETNTSEMQKVTDQKEVWRDMICTKTEKPGTS